MLKYAFFTRPTTTFRNAQIFFDVTIINKLKFDNIAHGRTKGKTYIVKYRFAYYILEWTDLTC